MKAMRFALACAAVALLACSAARAAERTPWQVKADQAVRSVVSDSVAEHIRTMLYGDGKNGRVALIVVEPDGEGVLARITIKWTGIVIAVDYNAVIRWRFNAREHISSAIESSFGMGVITDTKKTDLDDYLRKELYPKVQAEAAQ